MLFCLNPIPLGGGYQPEAFHVLIYNVLLQKQKPAGFEYLKVLDYSPVIVRPKTLQNPIVGTRQNSTAGFEGPLHIF